jgi:Tol biopolymer transport system component
VFTRQLAGGGSHVFTVAPGGGPARRVAIPFVGEDFNRSVWSHDGRTLLHSNIPYTDPDTGRFVGFRPAFSAPDGSHFRVLALTNRPEDMFCNAWSPDDRRIVCGDDTPGLFSMRARDGGGVRRLTHNPYGGSDIAVGFSPDGRRLALLRERLDPSSDVGSIALLVGKADGSHLRQLTPYGAILGFTEFAGASWSPNGKYLVSSTGEGDLLFVKAHGRGTRTVSITSHGAHGFAALPDYAPDGEHLVFTLLVDDRGADIYTSDLHGRHLRRLTVNPANDIAPDWGPARDRD